MPLSVFINEEEMEIWLKRENKQFISLAFGLLFGTNPPSASISLDVMGQPCGPRIPSESTGHCCVDPDPAYPEGDIASPEKSPERLQRTWWF